MGRTLLTFSIQQKDNLKKEKRYIMTKVTLGKRGNIDKWYKDEKCQNDKSEHCKILHLWRYLNLISSHGSSTDEYDKGKWQMNKQIEILQKQYYEFA